MGVGEFEPSLVAKHKTPEGITLLPHSCLRHLPGPSNKTGQKRGFCGRCGSFPQGPGAVQAGNVGPGSSLCSETGDEESRANSLLWKEAEIKQIHVYPVPSIGFILSQLKICLDGAFKAGDVCGTQKVSLSGLLAWRTWDFHKPSKTPLVFLLLSPRVPNVSNRNRAPQYPPTSAWRQGNHLGDGKVPEPCQQTCSRQGRKPGSPSWSAELESR